MWKKMENNEYRFDKRKRKKLFLKYFILFAIAFIPVVGLNILIGPHLDRWLVIFIDCVIMLAIIIPGNMLATKILDKQDRQLKAKIKEREELQKRKQQILEDSYKAKRAKKIKEKAEEDKK